MAIGAAAADALVTFLWVLSTSALGAATVAVTSFLGVQEVAGAGHYNALLVTACLLAALLYALDLLCGALGGASFNPTDFAASYAAGLDSPSLFSVALRFPAQAAGAVGGALAISELMPEQYKHTLAATWPALKVDPHTGALAEGALTFLVTLAVLWVIRQGAPLHCPQDHDALRLHSRPHPRRRRVHGGVHEPSQRIWLGIC